MQPSDNFRRVPCRPVTIDIFIVIVFLAIFHTPSSAFLLSKPAERYVARCEDDAILGRRDGILGSAGCRCLARFLALSGPGAGQLRLVMAVEAHLATLTSYNHGKANQAVSLTEGVLAVALQHRGAKAACTPVPLLPSGRRDVVATYLIKEYTDIRVRLFPMQNSGPHHGRTGHSHTL
jgi:hypothetical protein